MISGNANAPCSVNSQFVILSGSKYQQIVTSAALKLTAIKSSRRSVRIRRYSALIAAKTSEARSLVGTARLSCIRHALRASVAREVPKKPVDFALARTWYR